MHTNDLSAFRAEAHDFLLGQPKPLPTPAIARRLFGARRHEMPETQVVWMLFSWGIFLAAFFVLVPSGRHVRGGEAP